MFEHMTEEYILARMKGQISSGISTDEGTLVHDALAPSALILSEAYAALDGVLDLGFAETSEGEYLSRRASEQALTRKAATPAEVNLMLTGPHGGVVPKGCVFATGEAVLFESVAAITLVGGTGTVQARAVVPGREGNVASGAIDEAITDLPIDINVTNETAATGGEDEESDAALLARYLQRIRIPPTSGNPANYIQWAGEVAGVGAARCIRLWNGAGTVKVIIVGTDKQPVNTEIITRCYDHIEAVRPIGATVTVVSASPVMVDIAAQVTLASAYTPEAVTESFRAALKNMFEAGAFETEMIYRAVIGGILIGLPGVINYSNLTMNGQDGNIAISAENVAVLGGVVLTV